MASDPVGPQALPPTTEDLQLEPTSGVKPTDESAPVEEVVSAEAQEASQKLYDSIHPPEEDESSEPREREGNGRFKAKEDSAPSEEPTAEPDSPQIDEPPAIGIELQHAARQVYFTDDEINSFTSPEIAYSAILGRRTQLAQQYGPQQQQQQQQQPQQMPQQNQPVPQQQPMQQQPVQQQAPAPAPEFELTFNEDEVPEEYSKPIKEMAKQWNQVKAAQDSEIANLRQQVSAMHGQLEQSAQAAQRNVGSSEWDRIAQGIPGMVESMGLPSYADSHPNTPQRVRWTAFSKSLEDRAREAAPLMGYRDPSQIPEEFVVKMAQEVHRQMAFGPLPNQQGNNGAPIQKPGPGQVVQATSRNGRSQNSNMDDPNYDEYDAVLATNQAQWDAAGGNPYR